MCTGVEIALIAGTTMSAGSAIVQGQQAKQTAITNAELARRQGASDKDAAEAQAEKIRKAALYQIGSANAAGAASGVDINSGSQLRINEQINHDAETDAEMTILSGTRRQAGSNSQAMLYERQGRNAQTASLLSAGAAIASGWKAYESQRAPKPPKATEIPKWNGEP